MIQFYSNKSVSNIHELVKMHHENHASVKTGVILKIPLLLEVSLPIHKLQPLQKEPDGKSNTDKFLNVLVREQQDLLCENTTDIGIIKQS